MTQGGSEFIVAEQIEARRARKAQRHAGGPCWGQPISSWFTRLGWLATYYSGWGILPMPCCPSLEPSVLSRLALSRFVFAEFDSSLRQLYVDRHASRSIKNTVPQKRCPRFFLYAGLIFAVNIVFYIIYWWVCYLLLRQFFWMLVFRNEWIFFTIIIKEIYKNW